MNKPRNIDEFKANKKHFNEYTLQKKKFSIAREIMIIVQPKKSWYEGVTKKDLINNILDNFRKKGYYKKKKISGASISSAITDLNLYRDNIYIISAKGMNTKTSRHEFRYFCPYDILDISKTKELLQRNIFRNEKKRGIFKYL
jgi:hypothetical protein